MRFGLAALFDQRAGIADVHLGPCVGAREVALDQRLGLGFAAAHQLQRQQGRPFRLRAGVLAQRGGRQRARLVSSLQAHAADGGPRRGRQRRLLDGVRQRAFDHASGLGLVRHALVKRGQRGDEGHLVALRQRGQKAPRRLFGFGDAAQNDQHLQLVLAGFGRVGGSLAPGTGGFQRGGARTRLNRHLGGALEQRFVAHAARGVEHVGGAFGRIAAPKQQLANQQLVHQPRGHARRGGGGGSSGGRCAGGWRRHGLRECGDRPASQRQAAQGAVKLHHRLIIIHAH